MDLFNNKKKDEEQTQQASQGGFKHPPSKSSAPQPNNPNTLEEINKLSRRTRMNEERTVNIRKKIQMIEHNMLINQKKILNEIKFVNEEISDIKKSFQELKNKASIMSREIDNAAKKEDLQVLERYVNLWEPVNFVTEKEVNKIVEEKLREHLKK